MLQRVYRTEPDLATLPAVVPPDQLTHPTVTVRRVGDQLGLYIGTGRANFTAEQVDRLIAELQRLHPDGPRRNA